MNMGHMGPRPLDLPPMDMRRMDGPPMRGRGMDSRDMRNREPNRDFYRPREEPDFSLRRQFESSIRDKLMNAPGFSEPGKNLGDMGGRGMPPNNRFMDTRDREPFQYNMPQFNNPDIDGGRRGGFPADRRNEGRSNKFSDARDRPPMGDGDCFNMNMPPCDRRMDTDRRGGPPLNPRGGFDSDTDFRNRFGPPPEFRGRDRSPLRFDNSISPMDRGRPDIAGPQKPEFMAPKDRLGGREYTDSSGSPIMDYRSGEEMTLAEEWKNRQKDKHNFMNMDKGMGGLAESNFPGGFSRDMNLRDPPPFQGNNRPSSEFLRKDAGFHHGEPFPAVNLPSLGSKVPQDHPGPLAGLQSRDNEKKLWLKDADPKRSQNTINPEERPPYLKENNQHAHEVQGLKESQHNQGPARSKLEAQSDLQSAARPRDQDYRDIDYRTESGRTFDYTREPLAIPEKLLKEPKPSSPAGFSESVPQVSPRHLCQIQPGHSCANQTANYPSKDQDYRNASVEDKVSNTISIIGIPKTATTEQVIPSGFCLFSFVQSILQPDSVSLFDRQILGAFADRDGAPMQGMKIKNVVPGKT